MNPGDYRDPTPWASGITVSVLIALLTAAAVFSFGDALARVHPLLSIVVNLVAAGGAAPTAWRWRGVPVTRWVIAGLAAGVLLAWFALFVGLVFG
ncbi:DUF2537 domain-containing protein [Nocardia goodfellowii]|uniref:DUF2537 domain-containing protein n=1 Tax=Nocardia goodfellowii TaxID=882446 RepID=A0ABS4Q8Y0_9NOCA|nr:DUF2537 domain-containing protein [Nocardia goodfellowii]MBP2187568.1 hypothetical protein [Nocardia goodfellowii]